MSTMSLTPLVATSIILALSTWIIICYSFVINSLQLMTLAISVSSKGLENFELGIEVIALIVVTHLILMVCEALMIAMLVVQFLSSLDFLKGDKHEYRNTWISFHKRMFPLNTIILAITLCIFLSSMNFYIIYEVSAITINLLFLLTVMAVGIEEKQEQDVTYSVDINSVTATQTKKTVENSSKQSEYNINICSFLENSSSERNALNNFKGKIDAVA